MTMLNDSAFSVETRTEYPDGRYSAGTIGVMLVYAATVAEGVTAETATSVEYFPIQV